MIEFLRSLTYEPLYNALIFLYNIIPGKDFGFAIIAFTVIVKAIQIPLYKKQIEFQKKTQEHQPKLKEIQLKYKHDKERQQREMMKFYKENHFNPFGGCLPMILQMVFLLIIYRVVLNISKNGFLVNPNDLYSFIKNPGQISNMFLGFIDLSRSIDIASIMPKFLQFNISNFPKFISTNYPQIILVLLTALSQYFQTKMLMSKQAPIQNKPSDKLDFSQAMSKQMLFLGPLMTLYIGVILPAGLALYWLVSTLFAIGQQMYLEEKLPFFQKKVNFNIIQKK